VGSYIHKEICSVESIYQDFGHDRYGRNHVVTEIAFLDGNRLGYVGHCDLEAKQHFCSIR